MRRFALAATLAATTVFAVVPQVAAQTASEEARFDAAQNRFDRELSLYKAESDRYSAARASGRGYRGQGYDTPRGYDAPRGGGYYADDRYENGYDAARDYRDGSNYRERTLASEDRVYRGSDGRYYCKRSDGTTGLVVGAAAGGILGNVIDGGHSRTAGTLIGAAIGALAGKSIDQTSSQNQIRCR